MKYTAEQLREVAPVLAQQVANAPAHLRPSGQRLMEATTHITRFADLMSPFIGPQIEELTASYLLPQIHSWLKQSAGQPSTPIMLTLMPSLFSGAKSSRLFEHMGKLFLSTGS